jgi:hypothetical protein
MWVASERMSDRVELGVPMVSMMDTAILGLEGSAEHEGLP